MADSYHDSEGEIERQENVQMSSSALATLNRSEMAEMVLIANTLGNKRKLTDFDSKLRAYANHSQPIALSMFYSLPRAGKQIIGPSVRFAEIVAPCWRNCAVGARVMGDSGNTVTAQGVFLDYEANLKNSVEIPRRVTDKDGRRYSDDMIVSTANAAMSVARRNAVLKGGVPQALWEPAYADAQITAVGKAMSHSQRVAEAMEYLLKLGVTEWQVMNAVGVTNPKELETEHLVTLRVLLREIKSGDKTIEQVFGSEYDKEIDSLFVQLKKNQAQQTMLRNSHMGRAKQLADYLREQLGTSRGEPVPPPQHATGPVQTAAAAPATEPPPARPTPVQPTPIKPTAVVEAAPVVEASRDPEADKMTERAEKDSRDIWDTSHPTATQPYDPEAGETAGADFSFGENLDAEPVGDPAAEPLQQQAAGIAPQSREGVFHQHQTSMEPPPRKRGRPTREESARIAATQSAQAGFEL